MRTLLLVVLPVAGYAACTNPTAEAGAVIFSQTAKTMQYCNGTDWVNTGASLPSAPQTGCSNPTGTAGKVIYNNTLGVVQFCNGSNWVDTACAADRAPGGFGCAGATPGQIRFASSVNELQFCDSTNWVAMGWGCAGAAIVTEPEVVAYVSSSTNNLIISSLFNNGDWIDGTKRKRVVINSGVTIGSTAAATPALLTGTGRLNSLVIHNSGTIAGAGGAANSGSGGHALQVQETSVTVVNTGNIYGGGGGGGQGGAGSGTTLGTRDPTSGFRYSVDFSSNPPTDYVWLDAGSGSGVQTNIIWNDAAVAVGFPYDSTEWDTGGYRYYRGVKQGTTNFYSVARQVITTGSTTGGAGGRGQGSDGAATSGLAGGTNAGTGGAGGTWGQAGATGTAGNAGSGSAGGPAGAAITGSGYTVSNTGTILGTY